VRESHSERGVHYPTAVTLDIVGLVQNTPYGQLENGTAIQRWVLWNARGMCVRILTYGGIIESLEAPDRTGTLANVVLGLASLDDYATRSPYFGAIVGRYANRIARGRFTLDGRAHQLACNDGPNALHGGEHGFSRRAWEVVAAEAGRIRLAHASPDGEEGYPGTLRVQVDYALEEDALRLDYAAETDAPTVLNLSNHSYWNLGGEGSGTALDHELTIPAGRFTPVDETQIPMGELRAVDGTPFDFRRPTPIGDRIHEGDKQLLIGRGYDHNWVLDDAAPSEGGVRLAARVRDPRSGRVLEMLTDQPGLQFYSGNLLDGSLVGPSGRAYRQSDALVLETQHFPDSPNQPHFPPTVLRPGERFRSTTILRFTTDVT
jgi:aldose 1-epimerase